MQLPPQLEQLPAEGGLLVAQLLHLAWVFAQHLQELPLEVMGGDPASLAQHLGVDVALYELHQHLRAEGLAGLE